MEKIDRLKYLSIIFGILPILFAFIYSSIHFYCAYQMCDIILGLFIFVGALFSFLSIFFGFKSFSIIKKENLKEGIFALIGISLGCFSVALISFRLSSHSYLRIWHTVYLIGAIILSVIIFSSYKKYLEVRNQNEIIKEIFATLITILVLFFLGIILNLVLDEISLNKYVQQCSGIYSEDGNSKLECPYFKINSTMMQIEIANYNNESIILSGGQVIYHNYYYENGSDIEINASVSTGCIFKSSNTDTSFFVKNGKKDTMICNIDLSLIKNSQAITNANYIPLKFTFNYTIKSNLTYMAGGWAMHPLIL